MVWNLRRMIWGAITAGFSFCVSPAYAAEYTITDFGAGGATSESNSPHAYDINIHGEVVGRTAHALLWKGALVDVGVQGTLASLASAINNEGDVVGNHSSVSISTLITPFLWSEGSGYRSLEVEGAQTFARDINDKRQVVGDYQEDDGPWRAYLWGSDGEGAPLGIFSGEQSFATALNNAEPTQVAGVAVGDDGLYHAFLWTEGGELLDLIAFQAEETVATAINDDGAVVGWFGAGANAPWQRKAIFPASSTSRAFLWSHTGQEEAWTDLGTLAADNAGESAAYAINNAGQVVGYAETDSGELHAFLYTPDTGMQDLNDRLPANPNWVLRIAHGINEQGQIVGWGTLNGTWWPFLLTPSDASPVTSVAIDHSYTPQNPRIDQRFTLRTTVVNDGTETVNVRVQHTVAPELDITSLSEGCTPDDQWVECEVGELVSGESFVMTFELLPRVWGRWTVTGSATATTPIPTTRLAEQTVFIPVARDEPEIADTYHFVDMAVGVSFATDDQGPRINNWGEVALGSEFVYSGGVVQDMGDSGDELYDVNDAGWFAGNDNLDTAILDQNEGAWMKLGRLPEGGNSDAFAINGHGQVAGTALDSLGASKAFVASVDAIPLELGHFGGGESEARDINDEGWIVGSSRLGTGEIRAFIYRNIDNGMEMLDTLGGRDSRAYALNSAGTIVGRAEAADEAFHAARWPGGEGISDLGTLVAGGDSRALDINETEVAVGDASGIGGGNRAVRYLGGRVEDMNEWLPHGSLWQLEKASGINDYGEIVGVGRVDGETASRAFMMSPLTAPPLFGNEERLPPHDTALRPGAGYAVAMEGEFLAVGNPYAGEGETGEVAIYKRVVDRWEFHFLVKAGDGFSGHEFGQAVALDGIRLAVGSDNGVYIYELEGEIWKQAGPRLPSSGATVVALGGDRAAFNSDEDYSIYVFEGAGWKHEHTWNLTSSTFPEALALHDDQWFVGRASSVLIYSRQADSWDYSGALSRFPDFPQSFGFALAIDGDYLVVGAPFNDSELASDTGNAYVFKRRDGKWVRQATLTSSAHNSGRSISTLALEEYAGERFGYSVAIKGDTIAIGAPNGNEDKAGAGAVYIFQRHGSQWVEEAKLTTSDPQVNQQLGWAVAVEDGWVAAGAPNRADGAFYTYALSNSPDSADLQLSMTADLSAVGVGEMVTFTLAVANLSDSVTATGAVITATLPPELQFSAASEACTPETGVITCRLDAVPVAESRQVTITAKALSESSVSSQAWVSAYQDDPNPSDNETKVAIKIEPAPPPRVVQLEPIDGAIVPLFSHDTLYLSFEVEHFSLEPPDGRHIHWWLDGQRQEDLYNNMVEMENLDEGEHAVILVLAEADHTEVSQMFSTSFTIRHEPWPGVTITAPENGGEFIQGSPIQLRYMLEYNDVATGPQDFLLRINGDQEEFLEHNDSRLLNDLPSGTHAIEIRYKESEQPDATVTFTVLANNEPGNTSERPGGGSGNSGGGGRLDWLTVMFLAVLVSINGLRIVAKRC